MLVVKITSGTVPFCLQFSESEVDRTSCCGQKVTSAAFLKGQLHQALCFYWTLFSIPTVHVLCLPVPFVVCLLTCWHSCNVLQESNHLILITTLRRWIQVCPFFWCGDWGIERLSNAARMIYLVSEGAEYNPRASGSRGCAFDLYVMLSLGKSIYLGFITINNLTYFLWWKCRNKGRQCRSHRPLRAELEFSMPFGEYLWPKIETFCLKEIFSLISLWIIRVPTYDVFMF